MTDSFPHRTHPDRKRCREYLRDMLELISNKPPRYTADRYLPEDFEAVQHSASEQVTTNFVPSDFVVYLTEGKVEIERQLLTDIRQERQQMLSKRVGLKKLLETPKSPGPVTVVPVIVDLFRDAK